MKVLISIAALSVFLSMSVAAQGNRTSGQATSCSITADGFSHYANGALEAWVPGKFVFAPGGAGFVDHDGALGIKFAFNRLRPGRLFVGGRRLDGPAGPARAYIYDYPESGGQPFYLVFPTPGCWEITGGVGEDSLTFVVLVVKVGAGPSARFNGPPPGFRVTADWRESRAGLSLAYVVPSA
jgi:hypothetical protein